MYIVIACLVSVVILLLTALIFLKHIKVFFLKKYLKEKGLFSLISLFKKRIEKEPDHSWELPWDYGTVESFYSSMIFFLEKLKTTLHQDSILQEIDNWSLEQCWSVLKFKKDGARVNDSIIAIWKGKIEKKKKESKKEMYRKWIAQEYRKNIRVILCPEFVETSLLISARAEKRLISLLDDNYRHALDSGERQKIISANALRAYILCIDTDVYGKDKYYEALYTQGIHNDILVSTGVPTEQVSLEISYLNVLSTFFDKSKEIEKM